MGAAQAFLDTLAEALLIYKWKLHAYALMSNHFHLVLETPEPNLTEGMHWLLSAYSTRYNRFRKERGHLFQGRFHAGIIEDFKVLGHIVDYVHLNPVRAKLVLPEQAHHYRWSSLHRFVRGTRLPGLEAKDWLPMHGCSDTPEGWGAYQRHLCDLANNLELQKLFGWEGFSRAEDQSEGVRPLIVEFLAVLNGFKAPSSGVLPTCFVPDPVWAWERHPRNSFPFCQNE